MNNLQTRLHIEHFLLFVLFPLSLAVNYSLYIKLTLGLLAFSYVIWLTVKHQYFKAKKTTISVNEKRIFLKQLAIKFLIIIISTTIITLVFYQDNLFNAIKQNPLKYIIFLGVYIIFSVVPQEFVYRKFYFLRYQSIFQNKWKLILINSFVFSLCHLFFENLLVMIITLIGGVVFSLSYYKLQSFKLICLEHSLYGSWLYTIGLGGLLGFPVS